MKYLLLMEACQMYNFININQFKLITYSKNCRQSYKTYCLHFEVDTEHHHILPYLIYLLRNFLFT